MCAMIEGEELTGNSTLSDYISAAAPAPIMIIFFFMSRVHLASVYMEVTSRKIRWNFNSLMNNYIYEIYK